MKQAPIYLVYSFTPGSFSPIETAMDVQGIHFSDLLTRQWQQSDLRWICKTWNPDPAKTRTDPPILKKKVLQDPGFNSFLIQLNGKDGSESVESLQKRAKSILDEMGHSFQLSSVRFLGYGMVKLLKKFFRHLYVNEAGIRNLRDVLATKAVLLLPTHRSYADFVLISYLCFFYDLPLPIIAAGMDFKDMKFVGQLMRGCGAFFIRRSFTGDVMYWQIVRQYVQMHLRLAECPFEFFLEGTRSRHGMLSMALEIVVGGGLEDLALVPISISYERTMEDLLYAYELLGVRKPKESTSGLLRASTVKEDFGSVYVNIGPCLSVRELIEPSKRPEVNVVTPLLAAKVVSSQVSQFVVPLASCLASVLGIVGSAHICDVMHWMNGLRHLLRALGAYVPTGDMEQVVPQLLQVHRHVVCLNKDIICWRDNTLISRTGKGGCTLDRAAWGLVLTQYSNQLLARLALPALIFTILRHHSLSMAGLVEEVILVSKFLEHEFVQFPLSRDEVTACIDVLMDTLMLQRRGNEKQLDLVEITHHHVQIIGIVGGLLESYIESWYLVQQCLLKAVRISANALVSEVHRRAGISLKGDNSVSSSVLLTADLIHRNVACAAKIGILRKESSSGATDGTVYDVDSQKLQDLKHIVKYRRLFSKLGIGAQL